MIDTCIDIQVFTGLQPFYGNKLFLRICSFTARAYVPTCYYPFDDELIPNNSTTKPVLLGVLSCRLKIHNFNLDKFFILAMMLVANSNSVSIDRRK